MLEAECAPADVRAPEPRAYWCPTCGGGTLRQKIPLPGSGWDCSHCGAHYPTALIGKRPLPWLFPFPQEARSGWAERIASFARGTERQQQRLRDALAAADEDSNGSGGPTAARLARAHQGQLRLQQSVSELVEPLKLTDSLAAGALVAADPLPLEQGALSYFSNLFRDWSWENGEPQAMLDALAQVLRSDPRDSLGHLLTLGSGAGRLSFDLHQQYQPQSSTLLDLNPVLMSAAIRIMDGGELVLPEFPLAPLNVESVCSQRLCELPERLEQPLPNLHFVLGDACAPPFPKESFDTVLTPWLIDILPVPLPDFAATVNSLLPIGGRWLNTGSLAFAHKDPRHNYSPDEIAGVLAGAGFELRTEHRNRQRYLHAPGSAHGRMEWVYSFSAVKTEEVTADPVRDHRPSWLRNSEQPIPLDDGRQLTASRHLLNAQVLSAVDGQRSLEEISTLVSQKYDLSPESARRAVEAILAGS